MLNVAFQKNYITETDSTLNVSFLAFHYLDNDEEIKLFNVINTRTKGNGRIAFLVEKLITLSRFLNYFS